MSPAAFQRIRVFCAWLKGRLKLHWLKLLPMLLAGRRLTTRYFGAVVRRAEAYADQEHARAQGMRVKNLRNYCEIVRENFPKGSAEYRQLLAAALKREAPRSPKQPKDQR
jgi:hypothetical protein